MMGPCQFLATQLTVFESLELLLLVVFATEKPEHVWESLMSAGVGRGLAGAGPDKLLFRGRWRHCALMRTLFPKL